MCIVFAVALLYRPVLDGPPFYRQWEGRKFSQTPVGLPVKHSRDP